MLHAQEPAILYAGRWYLLVIPISALVAMTRYPLQGRSDFVAWNAMRLAPNIMWVGVLVLAWACARAVPTFVAAANLFAMVFLFFPFAALVSRRVPGRFLPDPDKWPSMLRYGFPCMLTMMPQVLNLRLDQMLMAGFLPPRELGLYVVAVAWSNASWPVVNAVGAVIMPAVASASYDTQGAQRLATGARATVALALVFCVLIAAITPSAIVIFFGEGFKKSIPAALVLVPASSILGLNFVLQEGLRGMGRPYAALQAELAGLVTTAAALAAMLRPMGIMGAAVASLLGYSTVTVVLLRSARRYAGMSLTALVLPRMAELRSGLEMLVYLLSRSAVAKK